MGKRVNSKILIFVFAIIFTIAITSFVSASCIDMKLARESYLPQETLQLEIDAELTRDLTTNDLFLYRGSSLLPNVFFMTKLTETKYFVWTDLPGTEGDYKLMVRGVCEGGLSFAEKEFPVVKPISTLYESLPTENFNTLTLNEHIITAAALSFRPEAISNAQNDFLVRGNSCFNQECTTKQYALSALAFPTIRNDMLDRLTAAQNSRLGNWSLVVNSGSDQQCDLTIGEQTEQVDINTGEQTLDLDLNSTSEQINVILNCSSSTITSLNYQYKETEKEIGIENGELVSFTINNQKCWGSGIKTTCDEESTTFAIVALKYLGKTLENGTSVWLSNNNDLIMAKAAHYLLTKNNETATVLLTSQMFSGGWPNQLGSYVTDMITTSIVYFSLQQDYPEELEKTEDRLKSLFPSSNLEEKAYTLFFVFPSNKIEPISRVWPGMVKTESRGSFYLILENKGTENITVNGYFMNSTIEINLPINSLKSLTISIPRVATPDERAVNYDLDLIQRTEFGGRRDYKIPVVIFTELGDGISGQTNTSEQEINETQQQNIINQTQNGSLNNQTTNITEPLLQDKFSFVEEEIEENISERTNFTITLHLANLYNEAVEDIRIISSIGLLGILNINPSSLERMEPKTREEINLSITPQFGGSYIGTITAEGKLNNQRILSNISVSLIVNLEGNVTCAEMNGTDCSEEGFTCKGDREVMASDTFHCCLGKCEKEGGSNTLAIIIIIIVIIILLLVVFVLKKKPKKDMGDVLDEVQNKYQRRFKPSPEIGPRGTGRL
ncbi:MAG: hypothetical protein JSW08_00950 [archaeon]|nr:MAG: hypothetical protein JSW08_00950 [archaeon]